MRFANRVLCAAFVLLIFGAECMKAAVVVSPSTTHLNPGQSIQFSATGSADGVYLWSLSGAGCAGVSCGIINSSGYYTAPPAIPQPGVITVIATSLADLTVFGTATVTMGTQPVVAVTISPTQAAVNLGAHQQFTATVTGTSNTAVSWSLSGITCTGAACGTLTAGGLYTAPQTLPVPAIVYVKATSQADSGKSATATVNLTSTVKVTVTPSTAQVRVGTTRQFTAVVSGTTVTAVTWSVSGAGCSGAVCGTITSGGLYTAPAAMPSPAVVTIQATSRADTTVSGTATVTIIAPVSISISPTAVVVIAGDQIQFHDTVVGTTNTAVTWSVSGATCSGSACGTISSTGLYVSPASPPGQMSVKVTVSSQATQGGSASATVTILRANNSKLTGHYAFLITGVDKNGVFHQAGSIDADGNGKILSGKEDVNDRINPSKDLAITGTYEINSDNRGVITLLGPLGTQTLRVALNSTGTRGRLIAFESGIDASGVIYQQDPTAFAPSALAGGYVISLTGANVSGERVGALGLIFPDGFQFISGSTLDVNEGGVLAPTFATFSGTFTVDATGRGTMTLSIPGFDGGVFHFAFYVVSQQQLLIISIDPLSARNPIFSGPGQLQSGAPFTAASFAGNTVFDLAGAASTGGDDTIGRMIFSSGNTILVNFDRNSAGAVTTGGVMTGAYDMELNGRGTLNLDDLSNASVHIWLVYATGPNTGFVMDVSSDAVGMGEVKPQLTSSFSNSTLVGAYLLGSGEPILAATPLFSGTMNFDGGTSRLGTGAVSGTEDITQSSVLSASQPMSGSYSVSLVSDNGRGSIVLTAPKSMNIAIWAAGPSTAFGLQTDATATHPTVLHIDE